MTDNIQRIQIRLNMKNFDKLQDISDRYGMSVNSVVSFIVGQWLDQNDNNASLREKINEQMIDTTVKHFSSSEQIHQMLSNPMMSQIMNGFLEKVTNEAIKNVAIENNKEG